MGGGGGGGGVGGGGLGTRLICIVSCDNHVHVYIKSRE